MKYIIDVPNQDYSYDEIFHTLKLKYYDDNLSCEVSLDAKPYTEPDRKAVDLQYARDIENVARMNYNEGAKDAWDFAKAINYMGYDDFVSCFGGKTEEVVYELSYSEVKAKYDAWKREKNEIQIGDEVKIKDLEDKGIVTSVLATRCDVLWFDGTVSEDVLMSELYKTGRHFDEVEELLKKMREGK